MAAPVTPLNTMNAQGNSGFYKAPVCKGIIGCMFITCSAIHMPMFLHLRQFLAVQVPQTLISRHVWHLVFNRLTFTDPKDLIFCALIMYCFRVFERRMGSRKFSSYLLCTSTLATIFEICAVTLSSRFHLDLYHGHLPAGLYVVVFPLYVNYFLDIPPIKLSNFLGLPVSKKTLIYFLGLQILSSSYETTLAGFFGIVAGILYRVNFLRVKKWFVVPKLVAKCFGKVFGWLLSSKEPKVGPMGATLELQRQEQLDRWEQEYMFNNTQNFRTSRGQGYAERIIGGDVVDDGMLGRFFRQRQQRAIEPSEENIQILVDMGFQRERAREALSSSNNNLETATSILLRQ